MKAYVGSKNPVKVAAVNNTLSKLTGLEKIQTVGFAASSGVPDQPMTSAQTRQGVINRINAMLSENIGTQNDWYAAIEGGVDLFDDGPSTFAYVAVYHKQVWSVGRSASLPLPLSFYQQLQNGAELGDVMDNAFNTKNIKQKGGAIGLLTQNHASRQSVYEVALTLALAKFRFAELYS